MRRQLSLLLRVHGRAAEACFNDVPLTATRPGQGWSAAALHEYVVADRNHLALRWLDDDAPAPPWARASAHVLLTRPGAALLPAASRSLMHCELSSAEADGASASCVLPPLFPRWRWQDAPPVSPQGRRLMQAHRLLRTLAALLQQGACDALRELLAWRLEELSQAYRTPARLPEPPPPGHQWRCPPAHRLRLRAVAGGRLHEALSVDGRPALACVDAHGHARQWWPVRLACIGGRWLPLR